MIDIPPGVVEYRSAPTVRVVTGVAGRGEACRLMVRICRAVVVGRVTGIAERSGDVVVAVDVAVGTLPRRNRVLSGQRPAGCSMIERAIHPVDRVVANLARRRKIGRNVVHRRLRVVVIVLVTTHTGGNGDVVIAVDVTIRTLPWRHRVITGKSPAGCGVIESAVHPVDGVMAELTCRREVSRDMIHGRGCVVVVLLVATHTGGNSDVVVAVDVTIRALPRWNGMLSGQGPAGCGVIERAIHPVDRVMALLAGRREIGGDVIHGRRRVVVVLLVTTHTGGDRDVVVVIDVAIRALPRRDGVLTNERESRLRMVEIRRRPTAGGVADLAGLRDALLHVIGVGGAGVVGQVARYASRDSNVVIVVLVAIRTLPRRIGVHAGQRKSGLRVIEACRRPTASGVADLAGLRDALLHMIGVGGAGVVVQVARYASRDRNVVVVVFVAVRALPWRHGVHARQRERGLRVIEVCWRPAVGGMAGLAGLSKAQLHVVRIARPCVIVQVARHTGCVSNVVVIVLMAVGALTRRHGMHSGERKAGRRVIKFRIQPVVEAVAVIAGSWKIAGYVVGISRILEIGRVAAIAVRRHRAVLAQRPAFVASVTIHGRVRSYQWKPIVVLLDLLDLYLPSLDRMTLFAIGAEQSLVDVGVAGRALGWCIGEDGFDVALRTSHRLVHPPQGILGAIVIEFRYCPNWLPAERRVAVLARHIQRAVGTPAISQRRLGEGRAPVQESQR